MLCAGTSLPILITGRVLQGLSAAVVWTVGLALVSDTVEKEDIGQAMGYVAVAFSIGALAGPLLGGVVYAGGGYYAVFAMGFGLIGLDIALRLMLIEKSVAAQWSPPNATTGESEMASAHGSSSQTTSDDEIQPVATQDHSQIASQSEKPTTAPESVSRIPPMIRLLGVPRMLVSLFGCFVQATSLGAFDGALPLYVKNTFHWNSTGAGLIFLSLVVPSLLSPLFGFISDRYGSHGTRALCTTGFLSAIPFWISLRFVTYNTIGQKVLLSVLLVFIGLCLTTGMAPLMAEIDHVVELEEKRKPGTFGKRGAAAQGFGLFNAAFALGALIGPLWAGFVVENASWGTMGWTFAILSGSAAVATFCWTGGRITLKSKAGGINVV
jgi:MFS family permease